MRSEYLGKGMPDRLPITIGTFITYTILILSIIGMAILPSVMVLSREMRTRRLERKWQNEVRQRFLKFIGNRPKYIDSAVFHYDEGFRGTGIAYDEKKIYIMQAGHAAEIEWDRIRDWSWQVDEPDVLRLQGGTINQHNFALMQNMRALRNVHVNNGLTLRVAWVDAPTWKFTTSDVAVCQRWMEILAQANERHVALAA